jgi:hypothetical protein
LGYCNASKLAAGSIWMSGTKFIHPPMVWRLEFPPGIQKHVISFDNHKGDITNSDLNMAGVLAEYLVIEHLTSLKLAHTVAWLVAGCNNSPILSWANKLSSSRS